MFFWRRYATKTAGTVEQLCRMARRTRSLRTHPPSRLARSPGPEAADAQQRARGDAPPWCVSSEEHRWSCGSSRLCFGPCFVKNTTSDMRSGQHRGSWCCVASLANASRWESRFGPATGGGNAQPSSEERDINECNTSRHQTNRYLQSADSGRVKILPP